MKKKMDLLPYALIAPIIIFMILLALTPAVFTSVASFFKVQPLDPPTKFFGLQNFRDIFQDPSIVSSIRNTLFYIIIGVTLSVMLGIYFALVLQRKFFGRAILIAVLILPWALPGVVEGILWTGIWDANSGALNSVLKSLHLITHYQVFLGHNRFLTILAISMVQIWQITPLSTILILASLQNIPEDLYEAALIDGSSPPRTFQHITLPLIRSGIAIAIVQSIIATLNIFDQPYILNGSATTANSVAIETYAVSFQNLNFGEGYAMSLLITLATLVISFGVVRFVYKKVEF